MSEKFPWLFERRFFIRAYDYWYGYSKAQIELMAIDQPITVFPKNKKTSKNGGHTRAEMQKIAEEWEKKHGKAGRVSEKINMSEFLAGGQKGSPHKD